MKFYSLSQLSNSEKGDILNKHKEIYNGYKTVVQPVSNTQPLYVQDFANDKQGITVTNKGEVKEYMNYGINEQWEALAADALGAELGLGAGEAGALSYGLSNMNPIEDLKSITSSDYNEMEEGECMECGEMEEEKSMCSECGGEMREGECMECGMSAMEEGLGDVEDLKADNEFDYVKEDFKFEEMESAFSDELDEETGPGPLYSKVKPAYDFKSDGPNQAKGPYAQNEEFFFDEPESDMCDDCEGEGCEECGYSGTKTRKPKHSGEERDTAFSRMRRGMGDVEDIDWEEIDEDLKESFITQKNKINEMFNRMGKYN